MENWKDITGFPGYQVSDQGRVLGSRGKILVPALGKDTYLYVGIYRNNDGKSHKRRIHRLVAEHFLLPDPTRPFVDHKNRRVTDNRLENLRWSTKAENDENRGPSLATIQRIAAAILLGKSPDEIYETWADADF